LKRTPPQQQQVLLQPPFKVGRMSASIGCERRDNLWFNSDSDSPESSKRCINLGKGWHRKDQINYMPLSDFEVEVYGTVRPTGLVKSGRRKKQISA
jgi:hypothetical protein